MPKRKLGGSLADKIADLDDPTPRDIDPEAFERGHGNGSALDSASESEDQQAREHYLNVGQSKLRKREDLDLGPQYKGCAVGRHDLGDESDGDDPFATRPKGDDQSEVSGDGESIVDPDDIEDIDLDALSDGEDDEIDSDEAFEDGDEEKFKGFTFRGSGSNKLQASGPAQTRKIEEPVSSEDEDLENDGLLAESASEDESVLPEASSLEDEASNDESTGEEDETSETSDSPPPKKQPSTDRAALKKLMSQEQRDVVAGLSQAAAADVTKGRAVTQQYNTFSALLNTRIRLQKALSSVNELPAIADTAGNSIEGKDAAASVQAAQDAALNLWNSLNTLRAALHPSEKGKTPKKPLVATKATPPEALLTEIDMHEAIALPQRRSTLAKWSAKTAPPSAALADSTRNRLIANRSSNQQNSILTVLDSHLSPTNLSTLVMKSQSQVSSTNDTDSQPTNRTYNDTAFYTILLRDLVAHKSSLPNTPSHSQPLTSLSQSNSTNSTSDPLSALPPRLPKQHRANVDVKASKGRKMRYTVHEKLQNFMPPDNRGNWGERQVEEFFAGLLGRRREGALGLDEDGEDDDDDGDGDGDGNGMDGISEDGSEGGLRLFGGA
ncbi:rRNA-processing protein bfr2 [Agyrium rufum]|nr:rRNA-processing protein bfr2 [Agyrium rufum]